jgi:hypothetical protein
LAIINSYSKRSRNEDESMSAETEYDVHSTTEVNRNTDGSLFKLSGSTSNIHPHLQSVQEESEVSDDDSRDSSGSSTKNQQNLTKPPPSQPLGGRTVKPSKRSRFK